MAKRTAGSELNADNWDQEEEGEDAGTFKQATSTVLATRTIKKAKRRTSGTDASGEGGTKAFAAFAGFSASSTQGSPAAAKPFSGLFNGTTSQTTPGTGASIFSKAGSGAAFSIGSSDVKSLGSGGPSIFGGSTTSKPLTNGHSGAKSPSRSKYLHQLKALNESVTKWIKNHVESNPYCILTPIFKDYEKHLEEINQKFPQDAKDAAEKADSKKEDQKEEEKKDDEKESSSSSSSSSEKSDEESSTKTTEASGGFSFTSLSSDTKTTAPASGFKFGAGSLGGGTLGSGSGFGGFTSLGGTSSSTGAAASGGFSFAVSKPPAAADSKAEAQDGDEEYVPPKPEASQVVEDDAKYTKKCKLFYKKDGNWVEKGLGNLFLKPCGEKTQLLIRADTSLGNILLNIMLTNSIPLSRQGKNNVALLCIPNPPLEEKKEGEADDKTPVGMLIKVKTAEDADELLEKLNESKR